MPSTRRLFLKTGATVTAAAALTQVVMPRPLLASLRGRPEPVPSIQDPRLKELVQRAIDVAIQSGAQYADVRLTHDRLRTIQPKNIYEKEAMTVGVRTLVDGYWGFSSSSIWSSDEMVRLAKESVTQAQTNALGKFRDINLAPRNRVDNGHWVMPVKIDPFVVHPAEIMDCLSGLSNYIDRIPEFRVIQNVCSTYHQEKAFGASDGSYFTQCTYRTGGELKIEHKSGLRADVEGIQPSSIGWELYTDQPIRSYVDRTIEELREDSKLSIKPIDVGRYDTVLSAHAIGNIISGSIGAATELDRALGYEANAVGTSYLNEPLEMLGQYKLGTSLLNVSATRNSPGGLAWVRWDDEGVEPESFQLVKEGIVVGFQTTRESAAWLQSANSGSLRVPFKSSGCAVAPRADDAPLTHTPDLIIHPGTENIDYNDLVSSLPAGIAFSSLNVDMDFQQLNGFGNGGGRVYEIKNGKKVALLSGAGILFRSPEFWKKISMLGGEKGAQRIPCEGKKGQPRQVTYHSVMAVPCLVKELSIIDIKRKA